MKTVYKYGLKTGKNKVVMPNNSVVLSAENVCDEIVIYARVDTNAELETRKFEVYNTGQEVNEYDLTFIGTVLFDAGEYVVHGWEL